LRNLYQEKSLGTTCEVVKNMVLVKDDLRK
jgi:hypothetical protein